MASQDTAFENCLCCMSYLTCTALCIFSWQTDFVYETWVNCIHFQSCICRSNDREDF